MNEHPKVRRWALLTIGLVWLALAVGFFTRAEAEERDPTPREIARMRMLDDAAAARVDSVNQWSWVQFCPGRVCISRMECNRLGGGACKKD